MKNNLLVDATPIVRSNIDGVSRYSTELLTAFTKLDDSPHLIFIGFIDDDFSLIKKLFPKAAIKKLPVLRRLWSLIYKKVPFVIKFFKTSKQFLYTNFVQFPFYSSQAFVVVHDLAFIDRPRELSQKNLSYLAKFVPKSLSEASAVIAISDFTKQRLIDTFNILDSKIEVISPAVNHETFSKLNLEKDQKLNLPNQYVLAFGTIEPRKNLLGIIKAYALLPESLKKQFPLVLAGKPGWNNSEIYQVIEKLKKQNKAFVKVIGYIDDACLPLLYQKASCLVFPSLYEGFGLPILEAQTARCPVITSDREPMKAIAGNGALFVNPETISEIADTVKDVLTKTSMRNELINKGVHNAQAYSWGKSAIALSKLIRA